MKNFNVFVVLLALLLFEVGARVLITAKSKTPIFKTQELIYTCYDELKDINGLSIIKDNRYFDLLILSASIFDTDYDWGKQIVEDLSRRLGKELNKTVRIHNLSRKAMSSRDSKIKAGYALDKDFDLILWYHGINDVRANNCPDQLYKDDYSHYLWYDKVNAFQRFKRINKFLISPYCVNLAWITIQEKFKLKEYVSEYWKPNHLWIDHGDKIKTGQSFQDNLLFVIKKAKERNIPMMVMTFAYYVPDDYSLEKYYKRELDWAKHDWPIEVIGKHDNVRKGMEIHNKVIEDVAIGTGQDMLMFLDMNNIIEKNKDNFRDVCHFTENGARVFVDNIVNRIVKEPHFKNNR
ncbi:MAG: hypothetical protein KKD07_00195 [Candidatus Omnitrophica bacterium]|nr:hypothetical protein [Candidatus Omnitrophota bacterium]